MPHHLNCIRARRSCCPAVRSGKDEAMKHTSGFAGMALDWNSCVHSTLAFEPDTAVSEIYDSLRDPSDKANYAAIVEDERPIGIISRAKIGLLLGSKYGQCLFGKKAAREYITRKILPVYN